MTQPASNPSELRWGPMESPEAVTRALEQTGYLADDDVATLTYLAAAMARPLLLEGEPGTGKTALAEALAEAWVQS